MFGGQTPEQALVEAEGKRKGRETTETSHPPPRLPQLTLVTLTSGWITLSVPTGHQILRGQLVDDRNLLEKKTEIYAGNLGVTEAIEGKINRLLFS